MDDFNRLGSGLTFHNQHTVEDVRTALQFLRQVSGLHQTDARDSSKVMQSLIHAIKAAVAVELNACRVTQDFPAVPERCFWHHPMLAEAAQFLRPAARLALVGMGGMGKSTTAALIANVVDRRVDEDILEMSTLVDLQHRFPNGVIWLRFMEHDDGVAQACHLHSLLDGSDERTEMEHKPSASSLASILAAASRGKRVLIILDDICAEAQLDPFATLSTDVAVLVTLRDPSFLGQMVFHTINLSTGLALDPKQAAIWPGSFLKTACGRPEMHLSVAEWSRAAASLGNLPLLLTLMGATCQFASDPEAVIRELLRDGAEIVEYNAALAKGQRILFDRIVRDVRNIAQDAERPPFLAVLRAIAAFPPNDRIPSAVFTAVLRERGLNPLLAETSLLFAVQRRIIERSASGDIAMHAIVCDYLRSNSSLQPAWATEIESHQAALLTLFRQRPSPFLVSDQLRVYEYLRALGVTNDALGVTGSVSVHGLQRIEIAGHRPESQSPSGAHIPRDFNLFTTVQYAGISALNWALACWFWRDTLTDRREYTHRPHIGLPMRCDWADGHVDMFGLTHMVCLYSNDVDILRGLLDAGALVPTVAEGSATQRSELFIAAFAGKLDFVKLLVERGGRDHGASCGRNYGQLVLKIDAERATASWCYLYGIHGAIIQGHFDVVAYLIHSNVAGTDNASGGFGWVDLAILHQRQDILEFLLGHLLAGYPNACDVQQVLTQCRRFLSRRLPVECVVWLQRCSSQAPLGDHLDTVRHIYQEHLAEKTRRQAVQAASCPWSINVRKLTGRRIEVRAGPEMTIEALKQRIEDIEGIPIDTQRLIFAGKQLEDGHTLEECKVTDQSELWLAARLRGGHPPIIACD